MTFSTPGMFLIRLCLLGILVTGTVRAESLIVADQTSYVAGARVELTLVLVNDAGQPQTLTAPAQLSLRPRTGNTNLRMVLLPVAAPSLTPVMPGAVLRVRYAGELPAGLSGEVLLEPEDFSAHPVLLSIAPAAAGASVPDTPGADKGPRMDADAERFAAAFSPYEPNYFSAGSVGPTNARFQVSLKFRVFNPDTRTPFLERLYLSYSQTSIWDLSANSKPFRDSSYRPSVFFLYDDVGRWPWANSKLGLQAGFEHESNGKDGEVSRSINILFLRPTLTLPLQGDYFFAISPKLYAYQNKDENVDISAYRGYADMLFKWGESNGFQLATTYRQGRQPSHYSVLLDLSYPLKRPTFGNLGGYLHFQVFDGYGESLIDYNQKVRTQYRIGLMITR